jgi:hypothetical protein
MRRERKGGRTKTILNERISESANFLRIYAQTPQTAQRAQDKFLRKC